MSQFVFLGVAEKFWVSMPQANLRLLFLLLFDWGYYQVSIWRGMRLGYFFRVYLKSHNYNVRVFESVNSGREA